MTQDAYTLEIIKNALVAIGDEMFAVLQRTSMSPIIYEALDFSVGLTDAQGNLIAQGQGTTVLLAMIDSFVHDILSKYGADGVHPGDVFIGNDPYKGGGTHLSDFGLATPIFDGEALVAFAVNKAHWLDVGGAVPGSFSTNATEICQEGIQIPICRIVEQGRKRQDIRGQYPGAAGIARRSVGGCCGQRRSRAPLQGVGCEVWAFSRACGERGTARSRRSHGPRGAEKAA